MRLIFFSLIIVNLAMFSYAAWTQWAAGLTKADSGVVPRATVGPVSIPPLVLLTEKNNAQTPISSVRFTPSDSVHDNAKVGYEGSESNSSSVGVPVKTVVSQSRSLCTLVGAFVDRGQASLFVERLAVLGVMAQLKNLLVSSTVGFWLHLPPQVSRKEVLRRLSELQRQGVDSYVIPDGDLANGISLGMFSDRARADSLRAKIASLGYRPEILPVPREKRELWVFLSQAESAKISAEKWSELISGKELLQKQQNLCSDVAPA